MVLNIVDRFHDRYDFYVVTRNYDSKSNRTPYPGIVANDWNSIANSKVYYLTDRQLRTSVFKKLIDEIRPSIVFLNSSFSTPTVVFLWGRRLGMFRNIPVIVSPCGSLAPACLNIKRSKKRFFLTLAKAARLYKDVIWKASFDVELREVRKEFGNSANVVVAPDLTPASIFPEFSASSKPAKAPGSVRLVYFSRIERKKNLRFLLERLGRISSGDVELTVIGPIDEEKYWQECLEAIERLPKNVKIEYVGPRPQAEALQMMANSHFFVLPTKNENFGYVFLESLSAGCPNITSDQTVWTDLDDKNAGWRIPLNDVEKWYAAIQRCINMDDAEYNAMSQAARAYAADWLNNSENEVQTEKLFRMALASRNGKR
jgi:glycosyltransferase involved in cell wall biosynthesis